MTLNDIYLASQIIAAVLVAPTLLYLALQVRQNTAQLRAGARYQFVEATGHQNGILAGDKNAASVFRRGLDDIDSLDPDERFQFMIFVGQYLQIYSVMFELYQDKLLPESQWFNVKKDIVSVVATPGGKHIWASFGRVGLDADFVACVNSLIDSGETSYDLTNI